MLNQLFLDTAELVRLGTWLKYEVAADKFIEAHLKFKLKNKIQRFVKIGRTQVIYITRVGEIKINKPRIRDREKNEEV
ncbi:MAG: hypothetical protein LBD41_08150 [Clostridiales Family XIII bacterium]|jgi:hypothetical protein|nr:hypothetical protein [Clostridiales Family XIII bacterium]